MPILLCQNLFSVICKIYWTKRYAPRLYKISCNGIKKRTTQLKNGQDLSQLSSKEDIKDYKHIHNFS